MELEIVHLFLTKKIDRCSVDKRFFSLIHRTAQCLSMNLLDIQC